MTNVRGDGYIHLAYPLHRTSCNLQTSIHATWIPTALVSLGCNLPYSRLRPSSTQKIHTWYYKYHATIFGLESRVRSVGDRLWNRWRSISIFPFKNRQKKYRSRSFERSFEKGAISIITISIITISIQNRPSNLDLQQPPREKKCPR